MEKPYINTMIKTLIINDNLQFSKSLLNTIINKFENVQLLHMATTYQESIDIIANNQIDLVFLDLKPPHYSGLKLISDIEYLDFIISPRIVVFSDDICLLQKIIKNPNVYETINKLDNPKNVYEKIKIVVNSIQYEKKHKEVDKFIMNEIISMGFKLKYKGTQYLIESIQHIYNCNNLRLADNLEQNVYKFIGCKYNKTLNNIKTSIIKATNERTPCIESYFNLTPKIVILTILNKIYYEFG